jgi:RNA polymerase sigma factor (sigma-70 family)
LEPLDAQLHDLLAQDRFVRSIARGLIKDPGRVDDVVQDTWWAAIRKRPDPERSYLPWLAKVARNFAFKSQRDDARRRDRETRAAAPEEIPSTAALVEREAARRRIVDAVLGLPDPLRTAVVLRYFDGLPPRAIAKRLGEPVETVKSRLKRALALLREKLGPDDRDSGHAFGAVLLALARRPRGAAILTAKAAVIGVLVMTTTSKSAAMVDASPRGGNELHLPSGTDAPRSDPGLTTPHTRPRSAAEEDAPALPQSVPATTGALVVRVKYSDGTAASDVGVTVGFDGSSWADGSVLEMRTDSGGIAAFESLPIGSPVVATDRGDGGLCHDIKPGERTEVTIALERGIDIDGVVVDEAGSPIAGAEVLLDQGVSHRGGRLVATCGKDGKFQVRGVRFAMGIWARAPGYAGSASFGLQSGTNVAQDRRGLRLTLIRGGGVVEGVVIGPDDQPVANAAVLLGGEGHSRAGIPLEDGSYGFNVTSFAARSDAAGRFRIFSLPIRLLGVTARARGYAFWRGSVTPAPDAGVRFLVRLDRGVAVSGVVSDGEGRPVAAAIVGTGEMYEPGHSQTVTDARGAYRLDHLPAGEIRIHAGGPTGKAAATLAGVSGASLSWSPTLGEGLVIEGRVVDSHGKPHPAHVRCRRDDRESMQAGENWTDGSGRFKFTNLDEVPYRVTLDWFGASWIEMLAESGVRPGSGELVIRIPEQFEKGGVTIRGTVVDSSGKPIPRAEVCAWHTTALSGGTEHTDTNGRFMMTGMPGPYRIHVSVPGFPRVETAEHTLAGGEAWDAGRIEVPAGGRVQAKLFREQGGPAGHPNLVLRGVDGKPHGWFSVKGDLADSGWVVPGRYEVLRDKDQKNPGIPVEIVAGETTTVDVVLEPAVSRTLRIKDEGPETSGLVHVTATWPAPIDEYVSRAGSEPFELKLLLDPGTYDLAIEADSGRSAKTRVVVLDRSTPAAVVPVVLR